MEQYVKNFKLDREIGKWICKVPGENISEKMYVELKTDFESSLSSVL